MIINQGREWAEYLKGLGLKSRGLGVRSQGLRVLNLL